MLFLSLLNIQMWPAYNSTTNNYMPHNFIFKEEEKKL